MGVNKLYNIPVVKEGVKKVFKALTGGTQKTYGTGAIKSVPPSVGNKPLSKLKIASQKAKASAARLRQTISESESGEWKKSGFTFDPGKKNVTKKSKKKSKKKSWKDHVDTSHPSYKRNWPPGE